MPPRWVMRASVRATIWATGVEPVILDDRALGAGATTVVATATGAAAKVGFAAARVVGPAAATVGCCRLAGTAAGGATGVNTGAGMGV